MEIYFGTILVEPHRWKSLAPASRASGWMQRALAAGFDGIELWERHLLEADTPERERIEALAGMVRVYSSYARFDPAATASREAALQAVDRLRTGVRGVKFNLGRHGSDREAEQQEAARFLAALPAGAGLWCECHEGTVVDTPETAGQAFAAWGERAGAILHPLGMSRDRMQAWFDAASGRVVHLHLQTRDDRKRFAALRNQAQAVWTAFENLRALGFQGSATIEFTAGVGGEAEDPERTFDEAASDLAFLRSEVGL